MLAYRLVIGTTNLKKGLELQELLAPYGFEVQTLRETVRPILDVVEDGDTFAYNARKKAAEAGAAFGGVGDGRR